MDIITTHANADFDALASMVAARKLYPAARLVLPGSQERAVREFMSLSRDIVKIEYEKDVLIEDVKRLIIVETRLKDRIGKMASLLERKGMDIHIYDHHPRTEDDIKARKDVYKKTGATTAILTELIKKRDIKITPLEATIMTLGIYEDTGSLTFPTTTMLDIDMVGFLVGSGADLNLVASYLRRELTDKELKLLAQLIQSTEVHIINSIHMAIASTTNEEYVDDLSLLAHKLEEAENYSVSFIMVQTKDKVQFIARSSLAFVDVARIAGVFGGGGHHSAAGAVIKDMNLSEVKQKLLDYLRAHVHPDIKAKNLISSKLVEADLSESVRKVKSRMLEFNTEYIIARNKDNGGIRGIASLRDLNKAISRGFGHSRLKGYISGKVFSVKADTSIYAIQTLMFEKAIGCVPVFEADKLLGIVTRSDVLRALHGRLFEKSDLKISEREGLYTFNLTSKIKGAFPKKIAELLRFIGKIAGEMDFSAFAVGGFVRDILLDVENLDIDVVIEGDAIKFAARLAKELCGTDVYHKRFGTATVFFPYPNIEGGKFKIDVAMTRTEIYERPAALPTVRFGPMENDLFRRDFTINAMAFKLSRRGFGELLDPFNGRKDLKEGVIRALHDLSFVDDPTRIFRAVRFEQRFNFRIEPHTEELIKKAIGLKMVDRTQKQRIREEIIAILSEEKPLKAVKRLSELNELRFISAGLKLRKNIGGIFDSIDEILSWYDTTPLKRKHLISQWLIYMAALLDGLELDDIQKICDEFVFAKTETLKIISCKRSASGRTISALSRKEKIKPSKIYDSLKGLSTEALLFVMAKCKLQTKRRRIMDYLIRYAGVKLDIRGDDFTNRGIKPGPRFKDVLEKTLYAKLDSKVKTKEEELDFAMKRMAELL